MVLVGQRSTALLEKTQCTAAKPKHRRSLEEAVVVATSKAQAIASSIHSNRWQQQQIDAVKRDGITLRLQDPERRTLPTAALLQRKLELSIMATGVAQVRTLSAQQLLEPMGRELTINGPVGGYPPIHP